MKKTRVLLVMFLLVVLFQSNLFSIIFSRVEGNVIDKETNQPINNVIVSIWVYKKSDSFLSKKTTSDANGKFVLNDIPSGEYFVMCEKGDYQTFSPYYYLLETDPEIAPKIFYLREGKVKHFVIKMKRGGKLKVNVLKKNENGISEFIKETVSLLKKRKNFENTENNKAKFYLIKAFDTENSENNYIEGLEPGDDYIIEISPTNFNIGVPYFEKEIEIKKDETTEITKIFDFTDKTGVAGKITFSNGIINLVNIHLINLTDKKEYAKLSVDYKGEYSFLNIQPGEYKLIYYLYDNQNQSFKKENIIKIESNIQKICNIEF